MTGRLVVHFLILIFLCVPARAQEDPDTARVKDVEAPPDARHLESRRSVPFLEDPGTAALEDWLWLRRGGSPADAPHRELWPEQEAKPKPDGNPDLRHPSASTSRPIIDMYLHVRDDRRPYDVPLPPASAMLDDGGHLRGQRSHRKAAHEMRRHGVVMALISGPLRQVLAWKSAAPGCFFASISEPSRSAVLSYDLRREWLRTLFAAHQLEAVGAIRVRHTRRAVRTTAHDAVLSIAAEYDVPVGIEIGLSRAGATGYGVAIGTLQRLERIVKSYPNLRIYLQHGGWPYLDETISVLRKYPNVYADLSVITWAIPREDFHEYLESLVAAGLADRLMFGSGSLATTSQAIEAIETASFLTSEQRRDLFYDNAARFLRLRAEAVEEHHRRAASVGGSRLEPWCSPF